MSKAEKLTEGIDVGHEWIHLAILRGKKTVHLDKESLNNGLKAGMDNLLSRHPKDLSLINSLGVTGSGNNAYSDQKNCQPFSSPLADFAGVSMDYPDPKSRPNTIIDIGAQNSLVIEAHGNKSDELDIKVHFQPSSCAAGKGDFLKKEAIKFGVPLEQLSEEALNYTGKPAPIASRCATFGGSDATHNHQKGASRPAIFAGLCNSVAETIISQSQGRIQGPVVFIGGVSKNKGVVDAIKKATNLKVEVPDNAEFRGAMGAAILAEETETFEEQAIPLDKVYPSIKQNGFEPIYEKLQPYVNVETWKPVEILKGTHVLVGIDVGSISTKIAVTDLKGNVLQKIYAMTEGQPLEANKKISAVLSYLDKLVIVDAAGATGSGRKLVGNFVGADSKTNEISTQARGISHLINASKDEKVTVIDIGGQDSKYILVKNGFVLEFDMNKTCAAGTGSFPEETSKQLGVDTRNGDFARKAFAAPYLIDLGAKCTTIIAHSIAQAIQQGVPLEVALASIANCVPKNFSNVVGNKKLSDTIVLTGATFFNEAVVSAFIKAYPDKKIIVPEHKEISAAIGAALIANKEKKDLEEKTGEKTKSTFKGFANIANAPYEIKTFNCTGTIGNPNCGNNCDVSRMVVENSDGVGEDSYYGDRCGKWESRDSKKAPSTAFDDRETFLYADYSEKKGTGKVIGIPRALTTHDLAQLLIGFLNELGVKIVISKHTDNSIIKKAIEKAHPTSCHPVKLLHGHIQSLLDSQVDYILIPNTIRMALKEGEENQHYSCPLSASGPYIVKSVFDLKDKLLDPVIDFSQGDKAVKKSFVEIAMRLGFSKKEGERAAEAGIQKQKEFEQRLQEKGKALLQKLKDNPQLTGVVILSRAYNSQDKVANMGIAGELAKLGLIPIPMDFLPLKDIDVKEISDRPYWHYQGKLLAASKIVADNPQLFGLFVGNYGCGPNSFILNMIEDIMGEKALGKVEIGELAAEAGLITRVEAFNDNMKDARKLGSSLIGKPEDYRRVIPSIIQKKREILLPSMSDHANVVAAAMRASGVDARVLPPSDKRSIELTRDVTNGTECLPYRDTLGQALREWKDGNLKPNSTFFMAGSYGPCRLGQYAGEQSAVFRKLGVPLQVLTSVSNRGYSDSGLSKKFEITAYKAIKIIDLLKRMVLKERPYEKVKGLTDKVYAGYLRDLVRRIEEGKDMEPVIKEASLYFPQLRDLSIPQKPLVGENGEIYVRANTFCNNNTIKSAEANGLEIALSPIGEWFDYINMRAVEDALKNKDIAGIVKGSIKRFVTRYVERQLEKKTEHILYQKDHSPEELLKASSPVLPSRIGTEAVLSLGSGILQMQDPRFAGVISVRPHGCMAGEIVADISQQLSLQYNKPWLDLPFEGLPESQNEEKLVVLAELARQRQHLAAKKLASTSV